MRPVWIATWAAQTYSALILVPVLLPVYGGWLPGWLWIGVPVQIVTHLGIAAYRDVLKRKGAWRFLVAGVTTTGTSFIFTVGLYILMTYRPTVWETLGLAAFGVFCLAFLVALDRFGLVLERTAPVRDRGILREALSRHVPESRARTEGMSWWAFLTFIAGELTFFAVLVLLLMN